MSTRQKIVVLALFGVFLFGGPLYDAFKQGVDIAREKFLLYANMDGHIVLNALNYYGNTPSDQDWTDCSTDWWDGEDKERLARWAGKVAYALLLKKQTIETWQLNKKLGNVSSYSVDDCGYVAIFTVKQTYLDIDNDFGRWCEKLWNYKKYGPGGEISYEKEGAFLIAKVGSGKISWKQFVLDEIKNAEKKNKPLTAADSVKLKKLQEVKELKNETLDKR